MHDWIWGKWKISNGGKLGEMCCRKEPGRRLNAQGELERDERQKQEPTEHQRRNIKRFPRRICIDSSGGRIKESVCKNMYREDVVPKCPFQRLVSESKMNSQE